MYDGTQWHYEFQSSKIQLEKILVFSGDSGYLINLSSKMIGTVCVKMIDQIGSVKMNDVFFIPSIANE